MRPASCCILGPTLACEDSAMPEGTVSWSEVTRWRAECHQRFGSVHDMAIVDISRELRRLVGEATAILDFGAGADLPLKALVDESRTRYWSLDADPAGTFDFADLSQVPDGRRFDLIIANQVLEHIPLGDALDAMSAIAGLLEPGGRFAATVP